MEKAAPGSEAKRSPEHALTRFILEIERDIDRAKDSIDDDEYAWRFAQYVKEHGGAGKSIRLARHVEREIKSQIETHLRRIRTKELSTFNLENAVSTMLISMTGSRMAAFLLSFAVVPPFQDIYNYVTGKKVQMSFEGATLIEQTKKVVKTSQEKSFSVNAYKHLSRAYQLWQLLRMHRRVAAEFNDTGERKLLPIDTE